MTSMAERWLKDAQATKTILTIEDNMIVRLTVMKDYEPDESKGEYPLDMYDEVKAKLKNSQND